MLLRKKENKKTTKQNKSKSQFIIIGSLLIITGISLVGGNYLYNYLLDRKEDNKIDDFYEIQEQIDVDEDEDNTEEPKEEVKIEVKNEDYVAVIKIPKIGLEKGLYKKESSHNNVNRNIQILKDSNYPDEENGNFILAGHSGTGRISYFRNVYKLSSGDSVSIFYNGSEYKYKVVNMYDVEKTGTAHIIRNANVNTLTLVTCRQGTNKQIIVICELVEKI